MTQLIAVNVTLSGPLIKKNIKGVVKQAMLQECLERIGKELITKDERLKAKGGTWPSGRTKYLGAKHNVMDRQVREFEMDVTSTLRSVRTKGTQWTRKNVAVVRGMAPRVLRKAAARIVGELSR